ncbi:MAG: hypothetical protein S4CHLAM37_15770 [Chlamydiia bacterium]|nr:hypothetical protein [Chlamydiia bacterium]
MSEDNLAYQKTTQISVNLLSYFDSEDISEGMKFNYTAQIKIKEMMGQLDTAEQVIAFTRQIQAEIASVRDATEQDGAPTVRSPLPYFIKELPSLSDALGRDSLKEPLTESGSSLSRDQSIFALLDDDEDEF